jgi:pre-rRNA-processing protein TSR3
LTTAEALCASVIISGRWEQGRRIIEPFPFGDEFLSLNSNPLEAYSKAGTNEELAAMQWEFFDEPESSND